MASEKERSYRGLKLPARAYVRCSPEHHHFVCFSCGSVEDTELCATPSQRALTRKHGFRAESHELEIYGTRRNCA